jgi:hypothetical protein
MSSCQCSGFHAAEIAFYLDALRRQRPSNFDQSTLNYPQLMTSAQAYCVVAKTSPSPRLSVFSAAVCSATSGLPAS